MMTPDNSKEKKRNTIQQTANNMRSLLYIYFVMSSEKTATTRPNSKPGNLDDCQLKEEKKIQQ